MSTQDSERRVVLKSFAAGMAAAFAGSPVWAGDESNSGKTVSKGSKPPPGRPGDFDFLTGEWRIQHRQRKANKQDWDEFDGEATCWSILGGVAHVEELRIPARDFSGMGLRLLDRETRIWSDFWVNAKAGALGAAGLTGGFVDGEGIFESRDAENGKPAIYRGVWDRIVPGKSHRWYQAASYDDGETWDISWTMDWRRA